MAYIGNVDIRTTDILHLRHTIFIVYIYITFSLILFELTLDNDGTSRGMQHMPHDTGSPRPADSMWNTHML